MLLCLKAIADVKVETFNGILSAAMHEAVNVSLIFLLITQLKYLSKNFLPSPFRCGLSWVLTEDKGVERGVFHIHWLVPFDPLDFVFF